MKKLLLPFALLGLAVTAQAQVFTDTFTSGTAADAGYYRFGTTGTTLAVAGGELDFTMGTTAATRSGVIKSFTEQTLAIGDSITFSFDITSRSLASGTNAFRWAIGNLGNPTAVTNVPVIADLGGATPLGGGTRQMYQFAASTTSGASFGQYATSSSSPVHNQGGTATALTGYVGPVSVAQTGAGSVTLTISRTAVSDYSFSQTAFGTNSTGTLIGSGTNIFNNIAFSMNNAPATGTFDFSLDNVSVSVIPEPSTALLLGMGVAGLALVRRRRNRA